ncbi:unnamed protein product [Boreogadus saida]
MGILIDGSPIRMNGPLEGPLGCSLTSATGTRPSFFQPPGTWRLPSHDEAPPPPVPQEPSTLHQRKKIWPDVDIEHSLEMLRQHG